MKIQVIKRGGGKTKSLLEWAAEEPGRVILVATRALERFTRGEIKRHGHKLEPWQVCCVGDTASLQGRRVTELGIDDLETVLAQLLSIACQMPSSTRVSRTTTSECSVTMGLDGGGEVTVDPGLITLGTNRPDDVVSVPEHVSHQTVRTHIPTPAEIDPR